MATTAELQAYAAQVAKEKGIPTDLFLWQIGSESSWNPLAKNMTPGSTAEGIAQFTDATAKDYGLTNKYDPFASIKAAGQLMVDRFKKTGSWMGALDSYGTTKNNPKKTAEAQAILENSGETKESSWFGDFFGGNPLKSAADGVVKWIPSVGFIVLGIVFVVIALMMTDSGKAAAKAVVTKGVA